MDQGTRQLLIEKLGTLMVANAELGSVNNMLLAELQKAQAEIARLNDLGKAAAPKDVGEGAEGNGAALDRHEGSGDNLPANPYNGEVKH